MLDKKQRKRNREKGQEFECKVRKDLESKGWIVDRWSNNVEFIGLCVPKGFCMRCHKVEHKGDCKEATPNEKLIPAKSRFGLRTTGFPDFIAFKTIPYRLENFRYIYEVIGIECKSSGYLTKEEKEKCKWLIKNNIFNKILIAKKGTKRGEIEYNEFK